VVGSPDVITYTNFGEDQLRGLGVVGCQSLPFSIDFDRRSYNTLALPCMCDAPHAGKTGGGKREFLERILQFGVN